MNKLTDSLKSAFDHVFYPRARSNDPTTSFEAAESIKEMAVQHCSKIYETLRNHGAMGKDSIAEKCGLDGNQVARRLSELERQGFIKLTGFKVKSKTGRMEREWVAIDKR